jgi:hypothetical protein
LTSVTFMDRSTVPSTSAGTGLASTITVQELRRIGSIVAPGGHNARGGSARSSIGISWLVGGRRGDTL